MGFLPAPPAARLSFTSFGSGWCQFQLLYRKLPLPIKEGYFEELVFKKEVEPKLFLSVESDHSGHVFSS